MSSLSTLKNKIKNKEKEQEKEKKKKKSKKVIEERKKLLSILPWKFIK